jgi:hypothetical protein
MYWGYLKSGFLLFFLALTGCGSLEPDIHKEYVGANQPASEVAIIRAVTAGIYKIDEKELKHPDTSKYYKEIYLPPGQHTISLYKWFATSVLLVRKGYFEVVSKPFSLDLKAGHVYELHGDRTTGVIRVILWIEVSDTDEIVAREVDPQVLE